MSWRAPSVHGPPNSPLAKQFARAFERAGGYPDPQYCAGLLWLHSGDRESYRRTSLRALELLGDESNAESINTCVWLNVVADEPISDPSRLIALQQRAVTLANETDRQYMLNTLAAAFYRTGRFQECLDALGKSLKIRRGVGMVEDWLLLAMVHQKLGHSSEAAQWLDKSASWLVEHADVSSIPANTTAGWQERLERAILLQEATTLVRGPSRAP